MLRIGILGLLLFLLIYKVEAQRAIMADTLENMLIYNSERSGLIVAHSNGLGFGYRTGKNVTAFTTNVWAFEAVTLASPKQVKTINPYYANSRRYIYGKLNEVFVLRAGYSQKNLLNRKPYWGGVELRWLWETGASLAIEKPYYLFVIRILQSPQGELNSVIESQRFNSAVSWDDIYGKAPFTKGISEIRPVPGIYGKFGFNFEFGNVRTSTKAAEIGLVAEFYPQSVAIMEDNRNQKLFVNFYASFALGNRFNKY